MDTGQQPSGGVCPGCGHSIDAHAVYCPNCGRPNQVVADPIKAPAPDATQAGTYATAPVQAVEATVPPTLPNWFDQPTTVGGIAELASGPAVTPEKPIRSHKRRNILTAVSALVVVVLIASGAYWAYAAIASRTDNQLARYFPSSTVAFASVDLLSAANNNFHINPADLASNQADALQKATGLDWQKDVIPWVGRDLALGVFPLANAQPGATSVTGSVGIVALVQSRDDTAAKAAVSKVNAHLKQQGTSIQQSSYKGFTLYASGTGSDAGLYGTGGGWVIIASNAEAAHAVVDRVNGTSDSLNNQQAFKDATSNLPDNRFGTYYLNLRQLLNTVVPVKAPNGLASVSVPFIETYPVAAGYTSWTNNGERSQIILNSVRNPNIPQVSGNTTGFASLVPSDAMAYAGVGNLGNLVQAAITQIGTGATDIDPLKSALGISATDPLAQQPAGMAAVKTSSGAVQPVFYVHVSDGAAATQLINKIAAAHNWKATPTTVAGQEAVTLYASNIFPDVPTGTPTGTPTGNPPVNASARIFAVALTLNNTLVVAPDTNTATLIAQVEQGSVSNLSSSTTFQKMVKAAPSGAAVTGYVGAAALQSLSHVTGGDVASTLFSHFDAMALTLIWNNSMLQGTFDTGLHS